MYKITKNSLQVKYKRQSLIHEFKLFNIVYEIYSSLVKCAKKGRGLFREIEKI